jgi:hypothetical protein
LGHQPYLIRPIARRLPQDCGKPAAGAFRSAKPPIQPARELVRKLNAGKIQANESQMAFIGVLLFSVIFPNRGFSKSYERKNRKFFPSRSLACKIVHCAQTA